MPQASLLLKGRIQSEQALTVTSNEAIVGLMDHSSPLPTTSLRCGYCHTTHEDPTVLDVLRDLAAGRFPLHPCERVLDTCEACEDHRQYPPRAAVAVLVSTIPNHGAVDFVLVQALCEHCLGYEAWSERVSGHNPSIRVSAAVRDDVLGVAAVAS